jgi:hypothetical protein
MKMENMIGMLNLQYGAIGAELVMERDNLQYFSATDAAFDDAIEVKVSHQEGIGYLIYTRMHIEGVDIDVTLENGLSDEYQYRGQLMEPIRVEYLG